MRRIIAAAFVSMDGAMQSPGGVGEDRSGGFDRGGWLARHLDKVIAQEIAALFARPFDLLLGRKTCERYAAHWPHIDTPIARLFNVRVMTVPVLLGDGKKLFGEGVRPSTFRLVESVPTATGAIISRYERQRPARPGIFNGAVLRLIGGKPARSEGRRADSGAATPRN